MTFRLPLGDGLAITGVAAGSLPVTEPAGPSPGSWATAWRSTWTWSTPCWGCSRPATAPSTLRRGPSGSLDEGDAVLVRRASEWQLLWAPAGRRRCARRRLASRRRRPRAEGRSDRPRVVDGDVATAVERFEDLRLGKGSGGSPAWTDCCNPLVAGSCGTARCTYGHRWRTR